jgi:hypothetical protein
MSAITPKADIRRHDWNVRFGPKADIAVAKKSPTVRNGQRRLIGKNLGDS